MWNQDTEVAYPLELTVCFESNISASAERKVVKYAEVVVVINSTTSYSRHLHTIQKCSCGMIDKDSLSPVKSILHTVYEEALPSVPRIALNQRQDRVSEDMV